MNYHGGNNIKSSGEIYTIEYLLANHFYEQEKLCLFDVGANVGDYTSLLLEKTKNRFCEIHSFEPSNDSFEKLKFSYSSNSKVKLNRIALGNVETINTLYLPKPGAKKASFYRSEENSTFSKEEVKQVSLDQYCYSNNITKIDLLKIDTEGNELFVLQGAKEMLQKKLISAIQFEFSEFNIASRTYFRDFYTLLSKDFKLYRILPNGLKYLDNYKPPLEVFLATNYLAILDNK